jgi:prephenate dehydrogenase
MHLLVVGAGSMGRWFADAMAADASEPVTVTFADADQTTAAAAAGSFAGDATAVAADAAPDADLVCVAVPIPAATDAIATHADRATDAVVDLTGTMREPVAAMAANAEGREQLSLHPLFAPENEPGNVAAVPSSRGQVTDTIEQTLTTRGNEWFETTPGAHDEAMKTVQARTHTAVLAFALAAESVDERFHTPISGPLADLADQVTDGEGRVYADIQAVFDGADDVADAAREIAEADDAAFEALYEDAGR